jgi:hypothetical protein
MIVPAPHIEDEPTVAVCINQEWASVLMGQIWGLRYPEAWAGTLEENRRARNEIKNLITMLSGTEGCDDMGCCVEVAIINRVNVTTGIIERSRDGGATWYPAPNPLQEIIIQPVPPVTSGVADNKCDAATNVRQKIEQWVEQVSNDFDTAESLTAFASAVIEAIVVAVLAILLLPALGPFEALIIPMIGGALAAVWGAGKAAFDAYWTNEQLDTVLCAAYCNIGEDGAFTDAQFTAFWNECNSNLPANPAKMLFMGFLSSIGTPGINTMAASGLSANADCGNCPCGECGWDAWELYPDEGALTIGGVTVSKDNDYWTIQSVQNTDGFYYVTVHQRPTRDCCLNFHSVDVVNSANFQVYAWCGDNANDRWSWTHTVHPSDVIGIMYRNPTAFTIRLEVER